MLALKYTFFAILSTLLNLLFQYLSFRLYDGFGALYVAMFFGTLAGLLLKYILDKRWIFYHTPKDRKDDAKKFILYSLMGVLTTLIFWGTETAFYYFADFPAAQYVGGALGLSVGYIVKYFLDRRFVFVHKDERIGTA
jgi:putative flippase GtrA